MEHKHTFVTASGRMHVFAGKNISDEQLTEKLPQYLAIQKQNNPKRSFNKCLKAPSECANCVSKLQWSCLGTVECECSKCLGKTSLKRCGECHLVAYCSKKCQEDHWRYGGHRKNCRIFSRKKERDPPNINHQRETCMYCTRFKALGYPDCRECKEEDDCNFISKGMSSNFKVKMPVNFNKYLLR